MTDRSLSNLGSGIAGINFASALVAAAAARCNPETWYAWASISACAVLIGVLLLHRSLRLGGCD